ncbi:MAG: flagella synthesis protein FlgN [Thalassotalea sp.]
MANEQTFGNLVTHQLTQVKQLKDILGAEKDILQQQNPDALLTITAQKQQALADIEAADQQLKQFANFNEYIVVPQIKTKIETIETLLSECKDLNNVNGLIIQHSSLAVDRMKSALLESRSKSSMTYDNKGKKSGGLMGKGIKA